nr:hyaluronan mediated motility receptor-like isoform X2 [Onthophagus taurus]
MENGDKDQNLDETVPSKTMDETSYIECEKRDVSTQYECDQDVLINIGELHKVFKSEVNVGEFIKLKKEHARLEKHLSNISMALSDVHQKYNGTKSTIEEHKANIKKLEGKLTQTNERIANSKEYVENSRKLYVDTANQYNKDFIADRESYENKTKGLMKSMKVLEIKSRSLQSNIAQVTVEIKDLGNLLSVEKQ